MTIHRATGTHLLVDVGHGHQQARRAAGQGLGHAQLVEIERVVVVDGEPSQMAQVAHVAAGAPGGVCRAASASCSASGAKAGNRPRERMASTAR